MNERPDIARQIADAQDRMIDQLDATCGPRTARFVANARAQRRPRRSVGPFVVAAVAVVVAVIVLWWALPRPSEDPAPVAQVFELYATDGDKSLALVDANFHVARGGAAVVRRASPSGLEVDLATGALRVDTAAGTDVEVRAGTYRVAVADSDAQLDFEPASGRLEVKVDKGDVVVESVVLGTSQVVVAGDVVRFSPVVAKGPVHRAPPETPEEAPAALEAEPTAPPTPRPAKPRAARWRQLLDDGDRRGALDAAIEAGFARVLSKATAKELLELGRAARYAKDRKRSKLAYQMVRNRFGKSGSAAKAAYALGRIAFDSDRDYGAAAKWFQTYLSEQPRGALAREALGRLIESQRKAGATGAARSNAKRYLDKYPDGPHADIARDAL